MFLEILTWVVVGLIAGVIVGLTYPGKRSKGSLLGSMMAGVLGASVAGIVYSAIEISQVAILISTQTILIFIVSLFIFIGITGALGNKSD